MIQVSGFLLIYCPLPLCLVFGGTREADIVVEFMMVGYINARGGKESSEQGRKHKSKSLSENW